MVLQDHHKDLLEAHFTSTYAGSSSAALLTDIVKLTGARVDADKEHLDLYAPLRFLQTFLRNVAQNTRICCVFTSVYTLETYQIKGTYLAHRAATEEENRYQQAYVAGFGRHRVALGMRNGLNFLHYYSEPCVAIRMKADEVYEQTPKKGTGKKISR